ncbi:hypothetical protein C6P75_23160 [Burkholderia multivorans]|nr:hypothetical protein C6P75_23160 [Burkholderia multivorans]
MIDGDRSGGRRQDRRGAQKHGRTNARHRGKKNGNQEIDKLRPPIAADKPTSGQADKRRKRSNRTHAPHYKARPPRSHAMRTPTRTRDHSTLRYPSSSLGASRCAMSPHRTTCARPST